MERHSASGMRHRKARSDFDRCAASALEEDGDRETIDGIAPQQASIGCRNTGTQGAQIPETANQRHSAVRTRHRKARGELTGARRVPEKRIRDRESIDGIDRPAKQIATQQHRRSRQQALDPGARAQITAVAAQGPVKPGNEATGQSQPRNANQRPVASRDRTAAGSA